MIDTSDSNKIPQQKTIQSGKEDDWMIDAMDKTREFANSHGTDTEKSAPNLRYQTIYRGQIDNFGRQLIGRIISIELINGKTISGKLRSFGQYDIIIMDQRTGQSVLIMKHAIMTVQGDLEPKKEGSS